MLYSNDCRVSLGYHTVITAKRTNALSDSLSLSLSLSLCILLVVSSIMPGMSIYRSTSTMTAFSVISQLRPRKTSSQ